MKDGLNELLLLAEEGMKWMDDAAQRFEEEAIQLDEPEKSKLGLLAAVYYERAAATTRSGSTTTAATTRSGSKRTEQT